MSLKETERLARDLESRCSFGEWFETSESAVSHFIENVGILSAPELLTRSRRRIREAYLREIERREWIWTVSAFALGLHARKSFSVAAEWSLRPSTAYEIRLLKRWGRAAEEPVCYQAMTTLSGSSSSAPFPSWEERRRIEKALHERVRSLIQYLRLQGDLRLATPLVVLYNDSLFTRAELTALRNENPFPYAGWLDDIAQDDPDDPSYLEDQVFMLTRGYAKSCAVNVKVSNRLFKHVLACDALRRRYCEIAKKADIDRMSVAWRRYHDACESLGVETALEEPAGSADRNGESAHEESSLESSLLNLLIALEALIGERGHGVQDRILRRATHLVAPHLRSTGGPNEIMEKLKKCYLLRDKIVHGVPINEQDWKDLASHIRWLQTAAACLIIRVQVIAGAAHDSQKKQSILNELMKRLDRAMVDEGERRALARPRVAHVLYPGDLRTDFERRRYVLVQ